MTAAGFVVRPLTRTKEASMLEIVHPLSKSAFPLSCFQVSVVVIPILRSISIFPKGLTHAVRSFSARVFRREKYFAFSILETLSFPTNECVTFTGGHQNPARPPPC